MADLGEYGMSPYLHSEGTSSEQTSQALNRSLYVCSPSPPHLGRGTAAPLPTPGAYRGVMVAVKLFELWMAELRCCY